MELGPEKLEFVGNEWQPYVFMVAYMAAKDLGASTRFEVKFQRLVVFRDDTGIQTDIGQLNI